jgi:transcriptional regulator with XRE-family HTH domain
MTPLDLRVWRTRQQLTQGQLAHRLGVHINTVNRWECGESAIPAFLPLALETLERRSTAGQPVQVA